VLENGERVKPKHFEFIVFDKYLTHLRLNHPNEDVLFAVNKIWQEVKNIFTTIHNWYNDHTLYHYVGYLFATERNKQKLVLELMQSKEDKDVFLQNLMKKIGDKIRITKKDKDTDVV